MLRLAAVLASAAACVGLATAVAATAPPWIRPLSFDRMPGWQTGASGDTRSAYGGHDGGASPESAAWIARNVTYRDGATADPPNNTLAHLPSNGVIVWAVIFSPTETGGTPIRLDLSRARHLECCDGPVAVTGGQYELTGYGPGRVYSAIVRIYVGAVPSKSLLAQAQQALSRLRLPSPR